MNIVPIKIEQPDNDTLRIEWQDGHVSSHAVNDLREACPCATCREKRRAASQPSTQSQSQLQLPVLTLEETQPTRIAAMKPVGNYAYAIHFNDGHDTGIFTLEFLRSFGGKQPDSTETTGTIE